MKNNDPLKPLEQKLVKESARRPGRFGKFQKRAKRELIDLQNEEQKEQRSPAPIREGK